MDYTTARGYWTTLVLGFLLTACSGGGSGNPDEPEGATGMLSKAETSAQFEAAVKQGLRAQLGNSLAGLDIEFSDGAPVALSNTDANSMRFTQTYTLEANVDEADIVKYTGDLLLVARDGGFSCCPFCLCADSALPEQQPTARVEIYASDPAAASVTPLSRIDLNSNIHINGMYVDDDNTLAVLGASWQFPSFGDLWFVPGAWLNGETSVSLHALADPTQPQQSWSAAFDGSLIDSRRIGDTLYLVSRFTPSIDGLNYHYTADEAERHNDQQLIDNTPLEDLIPKIRIDGTEQVLVQPADCYVPTDNSPDASQPNGSITTITAIPLSAPSQFKSTCYAGNAQGLYMSEQALYVVEQIYEYTEEQNLEFTLIHKFALSGSDASYRGSANVAGVLGGRQSMDFRLSEHDGYLRVVTSEYDYGGVSPVAATEADHVDHTLTVLHESATGQTLEVVSTLPNDTHPQEIGKPDERLYGVRFFAERAYLVTFEKVDPLYVLDLSDPAQPLIAGELEVPGFADFIHPVSDELILTLGKDASPSGDGWTFFDGMKIELFNVSDISNPQSISRLSIGARYTDSEALYDRHAFTYAPTSDSIHRFAIPIDVHGESDAQDYPKRLSSGLHLFEVRGVDTPEAASVVQHGELTTRDAVTDTISGQFGSRRSVFHDDAVLFVDAQGVWSTFWSTPDAVQGPVNSIE